MVVQKKTIRQRKDLAQMIGRRIRRRRKELGWRQSDLAALTGLSSKLIYQVEAGVILTSLESLRRLASALQVPLVSLLDEDA